MHRLFVAIRPPRAIRLQLLAIMHGIRGARWQDDAQLHLTLRFIGEVDRHRAEDVAAALGAVHHPAFTLALHGLGQFSRNERLDSLWAGVAPYEEVTALHHKVNQALARVGIVPETRAFLPHITIARCNRQTGPADAMLAQFAGLTSEPEPIAAFCLYESRLGSEGATYDIIARYPLD